MQNVFDRTTSRSIMQWAHKWARKNRAQYHTYADALREGLRLAHVWAAGKLHLFYTTDGVTAALIQPYVDDARHFLQPWTANWSAPEFHEEWRQMIAALEEGDFIAANDHAKIAVPNVCLMEPIYDGWNFNRLISRLDKLASVQKNGAMCVFWDRLPANFKS